MPRYSAVTFNVQPVQEKARVVGYVVSGFMTRKQLDELRTMVDSPEYKRSKMYRGEYQEMALAMVTAIDAVL